MPWRELILNTAALLLYPGALSLLVIGLLAEAAAAWALVPERGGLGPAARSMIRGLLPGWERARTLPPLSGAAGLLAFLAATQVAVPLNPLPASERNLLVATIALAGTAWLTWTWGWNRREADPRLMLVAQMAWLVALLAPAIEPQNLRPQALGSIVVPALLPLKLAAGLLYLLCLPALMQLIPEAAPQGLPGAAGRKRPGLEQAGFGLVRVLMWLPYCGLFASLYFPPAGDDALGLLRFAVITMGAAMVAVSIAANLVRRHRGATRILYLRIVGPFAVFTALVAILTLLLEGHHI